MSDQKPARVLGLFTAKEWMILLLLAAPAVMLGVFFTLMLSEPGAPEDMATAEADLCPAETLVAGGDVGGAFELLDTTGAVFTDQDLQGKASLVFFGFTYCPDACPTGLQRMALALDTLEPEERAEYQTVFISIDPERDTVEQMAAYVSSDAFPDDLIGLTGTPEQVEIAAGAYRAFYQRAEVEGASDYLMDHSTFIYLMDPDGEFVRLFRHNDPVPLLSECLQDFLEETPSS